MSYTQVYDYSSDMMTSPNGSIFRVAGPLWSPVNSPHKDKWRGALIFSLICARTKLWINNGGAGDLRHHSDHYDVTVMSNGYHCQWRYMYCEMSVQDRAYIISIIEQGLSQLEKLLRWRRPCSAIGSTQNLNAFSLFLFPFVSACILNTFRIVILNCLPNSAYDCIYISTDWSQTFYRNIPIRCFSYILACSSIMMPLQAYIFWLLWQIEFSLRIVFLLIFQISWFR